ncbi:MAG: aldehyde dehydrogenase family protein, partial [Aggregatilineales bacterium]
MTIQQTISPINDVVYVERPLATLQQIDATLTQAVAAQQQWKHASLSVRGDICKKMIEVMLVDVDAAAEELTWQMGRPIRYTPFELTGGFQERAQHMISIAADALQHVATPPKEGFQRFIQREPVGVVLVLPPWNYPYLTAVNSIVPAIMAGNAVVIKHSSQTPLVAERFVKAFLEAGLPEGVCQFVHATHDDVAKMIQDARVDFVAFTGSVAGGHAVQRAAGDRFIATGMELGGKDPAYIRV